MFFLCLHIRQESFYDGTYPFSCALQWLAGSYFCQGDGSPSDFQTHTYTNTFINILDMIAIIGTSDQPCWLAEACKIRLAVVCISWSQVVLPATRDALGRIFCASSSSFFCDLEDAVAVCQRRVPMRPPALSFPSSPTSVLPWGRVDMDMPPAKGPSMGMYAQGPGTTGPAVHKVPPTVTSSLQGKLCLYEIPDPALCLITCAVLHRVF